MLIFHQIMIFKIIIFKNLYFSTIKMSYPDTEPDYGHDGVHYEALKPGLRAAYLSRPERDPRELLQVNFGFEDVPIVPAGGDPEIAVDVSQHHILGFGGFALYFTGYQPGFCGRYVFGVPRTEGLVVVGIESGSTSEFNCLRRSIHNNIVLKELSLMGFTPIPSTRDQIPEGFLTRGQSAQSA
jgi:hypothetical protein